MTTTKTTKLAPGDVVHWLRSGLIFRISTSMNAASEVSRRGSELIITSEILAAAHDRNGENSMWDLVEDEAGQFARWGSQGFARGTAPEGLTSWTPGTTEADVAHDEARTAAWAQPDPQRRARAFADLKRDFGNPTTSTTLRTEGPR